jgi:hypothetical protein
MPARLKLGFRPSHRGDSEKPYARFRARLPLKPTITRELADRVMRQGGGSVAEQRRRQATQPGRGGENPWKRSGPFGDQPEPRRTLYGSGALDAQWAGVGPGAITRATSTKVEIGVTGYGALFQRSVPWLVRAKRLAKGSRRVFAMQVYLGLAKGAWIRTETLRRGLRNVPRPVAISRRMLVRAGNALIRYLPTGRLKIES